MKKFFKDVKEISLSLLNISSSILFMILIAVLGVLMNPVFWLLLSGFLLAHWLF